MIEHLSKAELSQLAKFKLLVRKVHHQSVDLSLLVSDASYAKEILDLAEDTDEEDLMMLAIEIRSQLGMLNALTPTPAPAQPIKAEAPAPVVPPTAAEPTAENPEDRYKFSLR